MSKPEIRPSFKRRFVSGALVIAAAGGLVAPEGSSYANPNPTERAISEATMELTGRTITAKCVSAETMFKITGRTLQGATDGRSWMLLENGVCTDIADIMVNPPVTEEDVYSINPRDLEENIKNIRRSGRITSLHTVTHEVAHIDGVKVESDAECAAIRGVGALAIELGVPENLTDFLVYVDGKLTSEGTINKPPEYALTPDCVTNLPTQPSEAYGS